jgi:ribosomal-protein-alanine N-acetyltransferase
VRGGLGRQFTVDAAWFRIIGIGMTKEIKITFPRIPSERLILRELTLEDTGEIFKHFANEEVTRYIDAEPTKTMEEVEEIIQWGQGLLRYEKGILWGIFKQTDNSFIGQINYVKKLGTPFNPTIHRAEIGYEISPRYWRKGFAAEAIMASLPFVFTEMEINRVEAFVHVKNRGSQKVLEKLGFHKEGVLREYVLWNNESWDMICYSMLKNDFDHN